jgi:hypothetical protein
MTSVQIDVSRQLNYSNGIPSSLLPTASEQFDLGSSQKLWRTGYLSELQSLLFAKQTIVLLGGHFLVTKNSSSISGSIPNTGSGSTIIDFGIPITISDFVLFRIPNQTEYMQILSLNSGSTIYNVLRNCDGSTANSWPAGSVFAVLGHQGDAFIDLDATSTPRISIMEQGNTYNTQTEQIRIGDLSGNWGFSGSNYGLALGEYTSSSPNLVYNSASGLRLRIFDQDIITFSPSGSAMITGVLYAGNKNVILSSSGITLKSHNIVDFKYLSETVGYMGIQGPGDYSAGYVLEIIGYRPTLTVSAVEIKAKNNSNANVAGLLLESSSGIGKIQMVVEGLDYFRISDGILTLGQPVYATTSIDSPIIGTSGSWQPVYEGFYSGSAPAGVISRYTVMGKNCKVYVYMPNSGSSNNTTFTMSAPFTAATVSNQLWGSCVWTLVDNGTAASYPGRAYIASGGSTITINKTLAAGTWTSSGSKKACFSLDYELS